MVDRSDIREQVRQRYADSARSISEQGGGCCGSGAYDGNVAPDGTVVFGSGLYDADVADEGGAALEASLGCGVPTAVADLREGEVVLDLGSGAGGDALISARRVGASGKVIGLDMTDEMLDLARRNAKGIAGALTEAEYRDALEASGWTDVEIRYTHEVHEFAKAAIVRAVRP